MGESFSCAALSVATTHLPEGSATIQSGWNLGFTTNTWPKKELTSKWIETFSNRFSDSDLRNFALMWFDEISMCQPAFIALIEQKMRQRAVLSLRLKPGEEVPSWAKEDWGGLQAVVIGGDFFQKNPVKSSPVHSMILDQHRREKFSRSTGRKGQAKRAEVNSPTAKDDDVAFVLYMEK